MIITGIERTKRGRYALFIDGTFAFSVTDEQMVKDHLKSGLSLSEEKLEAMRERSERFFARDRALSLLSARSYTRKGLFQKLRDVAGEEIAWETVDRMEELGLVNDADYSRRKASDLYRLKGYGKRRVVQYLRDKGIDRELADAVAQELEPREPSTVIYQLIERKYAAVLQGAEDKNDLYKRKGRVQNALIRLGYGYDDIRQAIRLFEEEYELYF